MKNKILNVKNRLDNSSLIHCITNPISINDCANVVLALGAKPIMAEHPQEVCQITKMAQALLVNLGNITDIRMKSIMLSGKTALDNEIPCIIDVVGVTCSDLRLNFARDFIVQCKPKVIKGNLSEIKILSGLSSNFIGIDSLDDDIGDCSLLEHLSRFSKKTGAILLATGKKDLIISENTAYVIDNGVQMLSKVTGTGCILGVMVATYLSTGLHLEATILAVASLSIAGELSQNAKGPSSFRMELIDNLYLLDDKIIAKNIKIKEFTI
ncbi:MAG: hydroxyethylthiazole kinase [Clostridia bacterium]